MTNANQSDDQRWQEMQAALARLQEEINISRSENRINSSNILSLQSVTAQALQMITTLGQTVQTHDRQIQQILQYLRDRNGGSSSPS